MSNEQNRPDHPAAAEQDAKLDEQLKETFPSSDPIPNLPVEGTRVADQVAAEQARQGDHAKGGPASDREATEKAAGRT